MSLYTTIPDIFIDEKASKFPIVIRLWPLKRKYKIDGNEKKLKIILNDHFF